MSTTKRFQRYSACCEIDSKANIHEFQVYFGVTFLTIETRSSYKINTNNFETEIVHFIFGCVLKFSEMIFIAFYLETYRSLANFKIIIKIENIAMISLVYFERAMHLEHLNLPKSHLEILSKSRSLTWSSMMIKIRYNERAKLE